MALSLFACGFRSVRAGIRAGIRAGSLCAVLGSFAHVPALADSAETDLERIEGLVTLSAVIDKLGRPSDVSAAGGACGGIVIHDWVSENVRVVTLGEMVDTVSTLR